MAELFYMNDIFDKIIAKEIPAQCIYEDEICIVVMDKFPCVQGQVLIISKKCTDYIFNLDDQTYSQLFNVTKKIATALDTTYSTLRTCVVVEGFEVPHVHIKLYPLTSAHLDIHGGKEASDEVLQAEATKIKSFL